MELNQIGQRCVSEPEPELGLGVVVSLDGGRSWSSIYNQATAEMYHVVVDNQFPYNLYGEQQDNSTIMVPSLPPSRARTAWS